MLGRVGEGTPGAAAAPGPRTEVEGWRLIVDGPAPGWWNMAVDEAIFEAVAARDQPPTLRLYRWDPPAVSLGYFQDLDRTVNEAACRETGVDVVRRPTGGRAVFHCRELTYSVCLPPGHPAAQGGVTESYRAISQAIQKGLQSMGLAVELARPARREGSPHDGACFDAPSRHELEWQGRKILGSAQLRRASGALLQHGSLLLEFDPDWTARLLAPRGGASFLSEVLRRRAASLSEALGRPVAFEEAAAAVAEGFRQAFGVPLAPGTLSQPERARAERLALERYRQDAWNRRRPSGARPTEVPA